MARWDYSGDLTLGNCSEARPGGNFQSIHRRSLLSGVLLAGALLAGVRATAQDSPAVGDEDPDGTLEGGWWDEAVETVYPDSGFRSRIVLNDAVVRLVAHDVIVPEKLEALMASGGGWPEGLETVLTTPLAEPIRLTRETARVWVNLLWPLGLANHLGINAESPIRGDNLFGFASTGGWQLGREPNGGAYFDRFAILPLEDSQEARVRALADSIFRPCCNNSAFFQDCNHGSAMYGLIQLGVSQGLTDDELYQEARAFNAFWFPDAYIKTAIYLKLVAGVAWEDVPASVVVGPKFSAITPWRRKVQAFVASRPDLVPPQGQGVRCGA